MAIAKSHKIYQAVAVRLYLHADFMRRRAPLAEQPVRPARVDPLAVLAPNYLVNLKRDITQLSCTTGFLHDIPSLFEN